MHLYLYKHMDEFTATLDIWRILPTNYYTLFSFTYFLMLPYFPENLNAFFLMSPVYTGIIIISCFFLIHSAFSFHQQEVKSTLPAFLPY